MSGSRSGERVPGEPTPTARLVRALLGAAGVLLAAYGGWLLWQELVGDREALVSAALWLGAGVVLHDFVLVPATLGVSWAAGRVLPGWWRAALAGGFVVLGSTTLFAVPLLVGLGGYEPNDTLVSRDYWAGWWAVALLVGVVVVVVGLWRRRRVEHRSGPGPTR